MPAAPATQAMPATPVTLRPNASDPARIQAPLSHKARLCTIF
ncbi:unnamed protein product [Rhodiola kirilowii]